MNTLRFAISEAEKRGRYTKKRVKVQEKAHFIKNNCVNTCTFQRIVISLHQK